MPAALMRFGSGERHLLCYSGNTTALRGFTVLGIVTLNSDWQVVSSGLLSCDDMAAVLLEHSRQTLIMVKI